MREVRLFFLRRLWIVFVNTTLLVGCSTSSNEVGNKTQWNNSMHRLSAAMSSLMPLSIDSARFYDERNRDFISSQLKELADASAELVSESQGQVNPIITHGAKQFGQEMSYASINFDRGNPQMSQFLISNISSHCISCHTSMDRGTKDFPMSWATDLKSLSAIQKTQFYLANRQYKSALDEAYKIAGDKKSVVADPEGWRQSIERTLAMLIRVEDDANQTLKLVQAVNKNKGLPGYIQRDAQFWLMDADAWRRTDTKKQTPKERYAMAVSLINESKIPLAPQNHSALVSNLRASVLFQGFILDPKFSNYPEALYYAGMTSELLPGLAPWSVNEIYYEACIRARPSSHIAMSCYSRLEASVFNQTPRLNDPQLQGLRLRRLGEMRSMAEPRPRIQFNGPDFEI